VRDANLGDGSSNVTCTTARARGVVEVTNEADSPSSSFNPLYRHVEEAWSPKNADEAGATSGGRMTSRAGTVSRRRSLTKSTA